VGDSGEKRSGETAAFFRSTNRRGREQRNKKYEERERERETEKERKIGGEHREKERAMRKAGG